ncbi:MAG: binding domain protein, excisionase family protein [candidate division Kazan bacterium GW2011_GWA1_50_15]|uniref:Binding domain protein, excisionase family protein n=2 Tax=Bacteria division Kazan-3B-28 TaxID=1798534 RepID=A0A0G1X6V4_UNCK3|nr:MAG: binding domain protein, excisionase family protein [candidate division Kazan bacterium GW2011_GWA1_50_15]KKW25588.1 MAG: binding domain protein, excisionase family protein [candidate division Kazan bacterium GW2011_GWC1_52_13]KKW26893.1 MAG: binding domain protein, excisionase family protein [candidate division Kazan bacterium GW2011_GWB1_52_7]HAV66115.1 AlpA family transcriptional regulator [Patescibacteria group bacterium]HCR42703.1 AlpA family transcriptional regulator [Patescibacter
MGVTDKLLSVQQVAKRMQISRVHVVRLINSGKIPGRKVGRNYVIDEDELEYKLIGKAVDRVVKEYGDVLKRIENS